MNKLVLLLVLIMLSLKLKAAEGCLVNNTIYDSFVGYSTVNIVVLPPSITLGTKIFQNSSSVSTILDTCPGYASISGTGGPCTYGPATIGLVVGGFQLAVCVGCPTGTLVEYDYLQCPLDDYLPFFGIILSAFGVFFIKKRIIQHSS